MESIDLNKYNVELIHQEDNTHDEIIKYLLSILDDHLIPEKQKISVRKQFDEIMRIKRVLMKPPIVVLTPKALP